MACDIKKMYRTSEIMLRTVNIDVIVSVDVVLVSVGRCVVGAGAGIRENILRKFTQPSVKFIKLFLPIPTLCYSNIYNLWQNLMSIKKIRPKEITRFQALMAHLKIPARAGVSMSRPGLVLAWSRPAPPL